MTLLRSYQQDMIDRTEAAWASGQPNVIGVLPTGAGKTMTMSAIAAAHVHEAGVAIAHRSVLIGQISIALARAGVPHDIVASKPVVRTIVSEHMEEFGRSFYVPGHRWKVASVDTLPGRAVHRSTKIIGNVVDTYRQHTPGKLGIVFAVDIEHAKALTAEFNNKGVAAELITAEHSEEERRLILRRYRNRETLVLVNVDLFGEGFDLPAIEVVMFARPTASYALYAQQFGRGLRLMIDKAFMAMWETYTPEQRKAIVAQSGKPIAHIHDHVGNVLHFYGPPDKPREWTLERTAGKRGPSDAIPLRVCVNTLCLQPYERFYPRCPYCGMEPPVPAGVTLPKEVDGDLTLYTPEMLRALFGVDSVNAALDIKPSEFCAIPPGVDPRVIPAIQKRHHEKLHAQAKLRDLMSLVMPPTLEPRAAQRKFFLRYGVDVVQAKLLGTKDTEELNERLLDSITGSR